MSGLERFSSIKHPFWESLAEPSDNFFRDTTIPDLVKEAAAGAFASDHIGLDVLAKSLPSVVQITLVAVQLVRKPNDSVVVNSMERSAFVDTQRALSRYTVAEEALGRRLQELRGSSIGGAYSMEDIYRLLLEETVSLFGFPDFDNKNSQDVVDDVPDTMFSLVPVLTSRFRSYVVVVTVNAEGDGLSFKGLFGSEPKSGYVFNSEAVDAVLGRMRVPFSALLQTMSTTPHYAAFIKALKDKSIFETVFISADYNPDETGPRLLCNTAPIPVMPVTHDASPEDLISMYDIQLKNPRASTHQEYLSELWDSTPGNGNLLNMLLRWYPHDVVIRIADSGIIMVSSMSSDIDAANVPT